jgi:regulator of protease activity HflC (stomatin/prohibitin superfamily)
MRYFLLSVLVALSFIVSLTFFACLSSGCGVIAPSGDEEAVVMKKPWFFGHGGVQNEPVAAGRIWTAITTSGIIFKITPITYNEPFTDMVSSDNTPVTFHAYLRAQIKKGETPILYKNFGVAWYENSLAPTFRAVVRDKASQYKMFDLAGKREVLAAIESCVFQNMVDYCNKINLPVTILQITIGAVTPPAEVLEETKRTAAQNQSILTQIARAKSEDSRKQAEINKAIADRAYQTQMGMNMQDYLHLRALEIEKEKIELVREKQNVSIIMGQGIVPTMQIKN